MTNYTPSTPDPETVVLVAAIIRHILSFCSGLGLLDGVYSDSTITVLASAVVGVAMAAWSLWEKYHAARLDHDGSVHSATIRVPMRAT